PVQVRRQDAAERGTPPRPPVIDRMTHLPVGAAVTPAAVREARPHEPHRPAPVTPVAVEDGEELLTIRHGLHVPCEGILQRARGRRIPARENVLLVAYGGRHR